METQLKIVKVLLATGLFIYILVGITLYLLQDNYLFFPDNLPFDDCTEFPIGTEAIEYNGERFFFKNNSENLVIFYPGNAASGCAWGFLGNLFDEKNYSFLVSVYPGFSGDQRNPSISSVKEYVEVINQFSSSYENIILMGFSIGSGAAAFHASRNQDTNAILLISSFSRLSDVAQKHYPLYPATLLLNDDFDNIENLRRFSGNLIQIHGINDRIVPIESAKKLFDNLNLESKKFVEIDTDHNNIFNSHEVFDIINDFLSNNKK